VLSDDHAIEFAARLADLLRAPRRGLDNTVIELGKLLCELCTNTRDAELLTEAATKQHRGRWSYPEVASLIRRIANAASPTPPDWHEQIVTRLCLMPSKDLGGLVEFAQIRDELYRAVSEASSEDHAQRSIDALLNTEEGQRRWRPTPDEIRAIIAETPKNPPPKRYPANPNCEQCDGTGVVFLPQSIYSPATGLWYDGTKDCPCRTSPLVPGTK